MLSSVEKAFVGRDEKRAPLKTPAWEAITSGEAARNTNRLVPTPFFLEHGSSPKTLISHPHNTASYAGYVAHSF